MDLPELRPIYDRPKLIQSVVKKFYDGFFNHLPPTITITVTESAFSLRMTLKRFNLKTEYAYGCNNFLDGMSGADVAGVINPYVEQARRAGFKDMQDYLSK